MGDEIKSEEIELEIKSIWLRVVDILFIVIAVYAILLVTIMLRGEVLVRVSFI